MNKIKIGVYTGNESLSLVAGVLLLLLLLVLNYPSAGVIRGGDEGSGMGGTGRAAEPGSGLGGTGLKPFLGLNAENEIEILQSPHQNELAISKTIEPLLVTRSDLELIPIAPQFELAPELARTHDSSAITIAESIQYTADANAVYFQELQQSLSELPQISEPLPEPGPIGQQASLNQQLLLTDEQVAVMRPEITADEAEAPAIEASAEQPDRAADKGDGISWESFAHYLANNAQLQAAESTPATEKQASVNSEVSRPAKIQRPELPPVQRLRPIQRASILPPRIQPFRL